MGKCCGWLLGYGGCERGLAFRVESGSHVFTANRGEARRAVVGGIHRALEEAFTLRVVAATALTELCYHTCTVAVVLEEGKRCVGTSNVT